MDFTKKSLLALVLLSLAVPVTQAMEEQEKEAETTAAKTGAWEKTKQYSQKAYKKAMENPGITAGAAIGVGVAGTVLYKNRDEVAKAAKKSYLYMKNKAISRYNTEKDKGMLPLAVKVGVAAGLGYGAYRLNKSYTPTLFEHAKQYASAGWNNVKSVFTKKESLWDQFTARSTGEKAAIVAGATVGAGLIGWLGWKAYNAYTHRKSSKSASLMSKFTESISRDPKLLAYAQQKSVDGMSLLEKAETDPLILMADKKIRAELTKNEKLMVSDMWILKEKNAIAAA